MQAQDTRVEPMRSHAPGWSLSFSERDEDGMIIRRGALYQVWAPQLEIVRDDRFPGMWSTPDDRVGWYDDARPPRDRWAASWQSADGEDGDFVRGESAEEVVASFPDEGVRAAFLEAING